MSTLIVANRLVLCADGALGAIAGGGIVVDGERIAAVGPADALAAAHPDAERIDHPGLMTPGLCDAHTHAAWMGSRASEYAMRMAGADYEAIAAAGGASSPACAPCARRASATSPLRSWRACAGWRRSASPASK